MSTAVTETDPSPDQVLLNALRLDVTAGWREFDARFRPLLETYARKSNIPRWEWPTCISEVLEDEAIRLSLPDVASPVNLAAYLIRASYNRFLRLKRATSCRDRTYVAASDNRSGDHVIPSLCSEDALRASAGPGVSIDLVSASLKRLAIELAAELSEEDGRILGWVSEGVAHSQIAKWTGASYDASTKRIWRLCRRLRARAAQRVASYSEEEQREIGRFLLRAACSEPATLHAAATARPRLRA